jgi:hypothetical protein
MQNNSIKEMTGRLLFKKFYETPDKEAKLMSVFHTKGQLVQGHMVGA